MAKAFIGAVALAALPSTLAFRNTSPFLLLSTADLGINGDSVGIAQSSTIANKLRDTLKGCPTSRYIVVRQEGVSSTDFETQFESISRAQEIKSSMAATEVLGSISVEEISAYLQKTCGAEVERIEQSRLGKPDHAGVPFTMEPRAADSLVVELLLQTPSANDRSSAMFSQNKWISDVIKQRTDGQYTIIYTTTPRTDLEILPHPYEMETPFKDTLHTELKRDVSAHQKVRMVVDKNESSNEGGLFETYQFLNPGLFMAFSATIPLVLILIVGIRALTSLEVSYFAFSKEMGPAAQRK